MLVTEQKIEGLRSLDDVRRTITSGRAQQMWETMVAKVEEDLQTPPLVPGSAFPGRDKDQVRHANRDYTVVNAAGDRVMCAALATLLTGDDRYRDCALEQMATLFDEAQWPEWRDLAHQSVTADLRTGQLCQALGLAYDWLHPSLSRSQREWVIEGLDRCGVQRHLKAVEEDAWWLTHKNNWQACVVGGLGIAGMAMGEDHPRSDRLIELSLGRMRDYLSVYGPEGEFNENVGYAGATRLPVTYFSAYQYYTRGGENLLAAPPFPQACLWYLYFTSPPGWLADFGDMHPGSKPATTHYAAVAAAAQDGVLQWYYLNYPGRRDVTSLPFELLWYDADLAPVDPEGKLPRGRAFPAHSGLISSRTDWNPRSTACVVFSKAGHGSEGHGNHDAGQVCIEGHAQKLIVDLGSPPMYPVDFFGANRYEYYNASAFGHNVLLFDRQEMAVGEERRAEIVHAEFDDDRGGCWLLDLTDVYEDVQRVRRAVIHLTPGVVAVLDQAKLPRAREISLRWHTADRAEPDRSGNFLVQSGDVSLAASIVDLEGRGASSQRREHEYRPPFDRGRLGDRFEQRHESYVEATLSAASCRLLTLFAVIPPGEPVVSWRRVDDGWTVDLNGMRPVVSVAEDHFVARDEASGREWRMSV